LLSSLPVADVELLSSAHEGFVFVRRIISNPKPTNTMTGKKAAVLEPEYENVADSFLSIQ